MRLWFLGYCMGSHPSNSFAVCCETGSGLLGRALGVRRQGTRQPLHDPEEEGALVLYAPTELSAHELMKTDQ